MNDVFTGKLVRLAAYDPEELSRALSRWHRNSEYTRPARNGWSTRTDPVKFSAGPGREGCAPLRVTTMEFCSDAADAADPPACCPWSGAPASTTTETITAACCFMGVLSSGARWHCSPIDHAPRSLGISRPMVRVSIRKH